MTDPRTTDNPLRVTAPEGRVALVVGNVADGVPMHVATRCAGATGLLRFAGDSSPRTNQDALFHHAREAFAVLAGGTVLMGGGTRVVTDDSQVAMTVLELPAMVRAMHPTCRTLGSMPRTKPTMSVAGEHSTFIPSDRLNGHTLINPDIDMVWIVQINASQSKGAWDMDVPLYVELMDMLRAANTATGLWAWGGGAVTAYEIALATRNGHPCGVVQGSGRIADAVINWVRGDQHLVEPTDAALLRRLESEERANFGAITVLQEPHDTQAWLWRNGF